MTKQNAKTIKWTLKVAENAKKILRLQSQMQIYANLCIFHLSTFGNTIFRGGKCNVRNFAKYAIYAANACLLVHWYCELSTLSSPYLTLPYLIITLPYLTLPVGRMPALGRHRVLRGWVGSIDRWVA